MLAERRRRGNNMRKIGVIISCIILGVVVAGGISFFVTKSMIADAPNNSVKQDNKKTSNNDKRDNEKQSAKEEIAPAKANVDDIIEGDFKQIKIEITIDDVFIGGKRKFLVDATNTSEYPFEGTLQISGDGINQSDCTYDLQRLQPGQTKTFIGKGDVTNGSVFHPSINGKFIKISSDKNLNYEIVKRYGGNAMMTYFVYVTDFSDENLIAISTEMYNNYGKKVHDLEVRFTQVHNNPSLDDSLAMYSIHPMNRQLNHKLVWFDAGGDVERVIATIP